MASKQLSASASHEDTGSFGGSRSSDARVHRDQHTGLYEITGLDGSHIRRDPKSGDFVVRFAAEFDTADFDARAAHDAELKSIIINMIVSDHSETGVVKSDRTFHTLRDMVPDVEVVDIDVDPKLISLSVKDQRPHFSARFDVLVRFWTNGKPNLTDYTGRAYGTIVDGKAVVDTILSDLPSQFQASARTRA